METVKAFIKNGAEVLYKASRGEYFTNNSDISELKKIFKFALGCLLFASLPLVRFITFLLFALKKS